TPRPRQEGRPRGVRCGHRSRRGHLRRTAQISGGHHPRAGERGVRGRKWCLDRRASRPGPEEELTRTVDPVRVLVADDDLTSRSLLQEHLARWGYEVVTASSGQQAIEILERDHAPQLAIVDWILPGGVD